jgi:uncharacterized protein YdaL
MEINIKDTLFSSSINSILRKKLPEIKNNIEQIICKNNHNKIIQKINCGYEQSIYTKQIIAWRIETEQIEELYDYNSKPYGLGCFWSMEILKNKRILHYNSGIFYNSFVENKNIRNDFVIEIDKINNAEIIIAGKKGIFILSP